MQDIPLFTRLLVDEYPVRLKRLQKDAFLLQAQQLFSDMGYSARISDDAYLLPNRNLIAGSLEKASFVFSAHYDTPYRMLIGSNTLFPKSLLLTILVQLPLVLLLITLELAVMIGMIHLNFTLLITQLTGLTVLAFSTWLLMLRFTNPNNVNDNTSGVLSILTIASMLPAAYRDKVAFVLFDNEEKGMLGSLGFKKKYKQFIDAATLINFDCVGVGDTILLLLSDHANKDDTLSSALNKSKPTTQKQLAIQSGKGYFYPSDQMHFKKTIVGAAFHRHKALGLYINKLHTARDQIVEIENITALSSWMINFMEELYK